MRPVQSLTVRSWFDRAELELVPVPWPDGEMLQMDMKMGGGLPIGTIVLTANKAKLGNRDIWHMEWRRFVTAGGNNQGISRVDADRETFRPITASFHHTLIGNYDAVYTPSGPMPSFVKRPSS